MRGSIYVARGTCDAWLDITYNYSRWYHKDGVFPRKDEGGNSLGICSIYGLSSADSITVLTHAIQAPGGVG